METTFKGIKFNDKDVVNAQSDFIAKDSFNPYNQHPWLLHDHGFVLCVVFASSLQDALDIAVDEGKLDRFQITDAEREDYWDKETNDYNDQVTFLGNASEPFDIESLGVEELPNPAYSWVAMFAADQANNKESQS